ncbi:MAG: MFS transporter, partial [Deltaproteobacteria bacterium]|nr:MFS transporter [Deltaproteobacteria bacterium]
MQVLRSFRHYNFRLYFAGQAASLIGIWMQGTAVSWLTWRLTHSPKWLGAVGFAVQVPILIFGLFAGVVADRVTRRRLIIFIQVLAMAQAVLMAVLALLNVITVEAIFLLSLFLGTVFAFDYPARQSFLMDMVGTEDITNAVALNSSIVHGARVLGPVVAGFIVAMYGEGICFAINAASFLFVLLGLILMRKNELNPQPLELNHSVGKSITEALKFVWSESSLKQPLLLLGVFSLSIMPYITLMPQIVETRFGGTARELGFTMGAAGFGALLGAIALAIRKQQSGLLELVKISLGISAVSLTAVAVIPNMFLAMPVLIILGLAGFFVVASTATILQIGSPAPLRGRIMSIFTVAFFGLVPIGSLVAGVTASYIGPAWTLTIGGIICGIVAGRHLFYHP